MKKLTKINLHNLSQAELSEREENLLMGGKKTCACAGGAVPCGCLYEGEKENENDSYYEGASTDSNSYVNFDQKVTFKVSDATNDYM